MMSYGMRSITASSSSSPKIHRSIPGAMCPDGVQSSSPGESSPGEATPFERARKGEDCWLHMKSLFGSNWLRWAIDSSLFVRKLLSSRGKGQSRFDPRARNGANMKLKGGNLSMTERGKNWMTADSIIL